ncbi:MAG: hypothetical protein JNL82_24800 [Myxococcales bacterium]|nr:hypothetical protein [Myxococcales bacterium]
MLQAFSGRTARPVQCARAQVGVTRAELRRMAQTAHDLNMAYFGNTNYPEKESQNTVAIIKLANDQGDNRAGDYICITQRYYKAIYDAAPDHDIAAVTNPDSTDAANIHAEELAVQEFGGNIAGMGISKPPCGRNFRDCERLLARQRIPYAYWTRDGVVDG